MHGPDHKADGPSNLAAESKVPLTFTLRNLIGDWRYIGDGKQANSLKS